MAEEIQEVKGLKGPDLDVFEIGPGGEKRPLPDAAERERRFQAELSANPKLERQILDDFHDGLESNHKFAEASTEPDTDEMERMLRAAYKLTHEFPDALKQRVEPLGFKLRGMLPNGEGTGYKIYTNDKEGRPFVVDMKHEDTNSTFSQWGESMGIALVNLITERLIEARKKYLARLEPAKLQSDLIILP